MSGADDDAVGYGRPPKKHRFQKGRSGNPKGRPRTALTPAEVLAKISGEKITMVIDGKPRKVGMFEAALRSAFNRALSSPSARNLEGLMKLIEKHGGTMEQLIPVSVIKKSADEAMEKMLRYFDRTIPDDPEEIADCTRREDEERELISTCPHCGPVLRERWKNDDRVSGSPKRSTQLRSFVEHGP